jgi:hypothetical protein
MHVTTTKEFVIELENRPGTLGEVAQRLGKESINILGFAAISQGTKSYAHLVTEDPSTAQGVLKQGGYRVTQRDAIIVSVPNEAGQLGSIASTLGDKGINIEACFVTTGPDSDEVQCAFCVPDVVKAQQALASLGD